MIANKTERDRSGSKKKRGISLSLTPGKHQPIDGQVDLPMVNAHYYASGQSSIHHKRVSFSYQSPAGSEINTGRQKNNHFLESNSIHQSQILDSLAIINHQPIAKDDIPNILNQQLSSSPSSVFERVELRHTQANQSQNKNNGFIRPEVFDIVQEISSKVYKSKNDINGEQILSKQNSPNKIVNLQKQKSINKNLSLTSQNHKKRSSSNQVQNGHLEIIPQRTVQTSEQLVVIHSMLNQQSHNLSSNQQIDLYGNLQNNLQKNRIYRLQKAQEKLLNIIRVCEYGL